MVLAEKSIKSGAEINATEGSGRTPLIIAIQMNDLEMVQFFLKYKADVNHIDADYNNNALKRTQFPEKRVTNRFGSHSGKP